MSGFAAWLLTLPHVLIYAVCGAVAGATGVLVGRAGTRIFGRRLAWRLTGIIFIVASVQITSGVVIPALEQSAGPYEALRVLKQNRLFQVIFKYHPDAEVETREKLKVLMAGRPGISASSSARAAGAALAEKYVKVHALTASDDAISALLRSELAISNATESQPGACVALYLGNGAAAEEQLPKDLIDAKDNARAAVIETSVTHPSPPPTDVSMDAIAKVLSKAYQANGFDVREIDKLGEVGALPAKESCAVAHEFLVAVTSLDPKHAAAVYKGLLSLGKQPAF